MAERRKFSPEAWRRAAALTQEVDDATKAIAERLAQHEGAEKVLCSHVDAAFNALRSLGLQRTRWYRSVTFETTIGGAFTTIAGILAGLAPTLGLSTGAGVAGCTLLGCVGIGLVIHAWTRGNY